MAITHRNKTFDPTKVDYYVNHKEFEDGRLRIQSSMRPSVMKLMKDKGFLYTETPENVKGVFYAWFNKTKEFAAKEKHKKR